MPLVLEIINRPEDEDLLDLEKIYADYPAAGEIRPWQQRQLDCNNTLVGGRFNDRLIAACWLGPANPERAINNLCVRKLTRRRGVARQLLTLLIAHKDAPLAIDISACPEIQPLLEELGFKAEQGRWLLS